MALLIKGLKVSDVSDISEAVNAKIYNLEKLINSNDTFEGLKEPYTKELEKFKKIKELLNYTNLENI